MRADQIARIPKDPGKGIELSVRDLLRVPEGESARQALMGPALLAIGAILMLLGLFVTC